MMDRIRSNQVDPQPPMAAAPSSAGPRTERTFVGRQAELAQLRSGLDVLRRGEGTAFLVCGEAGIGKTRLAAQFSKEATAAGISVVWGRCWEAGGAASYWPWVEVIHEILGPGEPVDLGSQGRFLAQLVPDLADRFGADGLTAPSPSDPDSARFLMFDAVHALLRRSAERGPLVVVIDDLHVADRASLLLLTFLARRSTGLPLLFLGTMRDGDANVSNDLFETLADVERHTRRIELKGLTTSDIASLLQSESGTEASRTLVERIHDATAGNALFVDEALRCLAADWVPGDVSATLDLPVPSGARDAVRRSLAKMSRASADTLEVAAVVGREFDVTIVARALDQTAAEVLAHLERPIAVGTIAEIRPGRLQFRHALIRDTIYDSLLPVRRASLHHRVGEALERLADRSPDRHVGELAHHFLLAAPVSDSRFIKYAISAARRALAMMAFEEAVRLCERALDAFDFAQADERLRCELLLGLAAAKEWANDVVGSRRCFEDAAAIARVLDATDLFVRAALGVGAVAARKFTATSRYESAPLLIREALQRIDEADSAKKALLLSRLALDHLTAGSRDEANSLSTEAIGLARHSGDKEVLAETLVARHSILFGPDAMEARRQLADEVLEIGTKLLRTDLVMRGYALRFTIRFECGEVHGADHDLEQHRHLAERLSDPFDRWANLVWRATRFLLAGEYDQAQESAERAIELARNVPGPHSLEVNGPAAYQAQVLLIADTATRDLPRALVAASYRSRFPEVSAWQAADILLHMRANDRDSVALELDRLAAHGFRDFPRNGVWLFTMSIISEAIAFVRDRERAALVYPMLLPFSGLHATPSLVASWGSVARYLGLLAGTLEQWTEADRHFTDAATMNRAMGAQPFLAKTLFDHGRMLIERPQVAALKRGLSLLRQAHALATRLSMPGLLRDCEAIMATVHRPHENASSLSLHSMDQVGATWVIRYRDTQTPLRNMRGMAYIAELLRHPDREILAIDLIHALSADSTDLSPARTEHVRGAVRRRRGFTEDVVDAKARREYKRRLATLERELSTAETQGDPERVLELRDEINQLERELSRVIGLGGRARQSSDTERARISVTRAIHLALGRIVEVAPEAGATLAQFIRTGTWCCYAPDAGADAQGPGNTWQE